MLTGRDNLIARCRRLVGEGVAVATDAWQSARVGFARLFGRDDPVRQRRAETRLDATVADLVVAAMEGLAQAAVVLGRRRHAAELATEAGAMRQRIERQPPP